MTPKITKVRNKMSYHNENFHVLRGPARVEPPPSRWIEICEPRTRKTGARKIGMFNDQPVFLSAGTLLQVVNTPDPLTGHHTCGVFFHDGSQTNLGGLPGRGLISD